MKRVIATVGPSLLHRVPISKIHRDEYIYRINGAHGTLKDIEAYIAKIRGQVNSAQILIDLPGNKVRTANLDEPIALQKEGEFSLLSHQTNYCYFYKHLKKGDTVWANDSVFRFIVDDVGEDKITFLSKSDGILLNNKGLHVRGIHEDIPFLFAKDMGLIEIANKHNVDFVGLSFVRNSEDVLTAKKYIKPEIALISKIETKAAVDNIQSILREVEYILVDRGDLSTEVGLEKIPSYQAYIIDKGLFDNKKIFLATQFLKNMEDKPIPTIAEVIDLYNSFKSGIYGIQLSEETAVGMFPEECLEMVQRLVREIDDEIK